MRDWSFIQGGVTLIRLALMKTKETCKHRPFASSWPGGRFNFAYRNFNSTVYIIYMYMMQFSYKVNEILTIRIALFLWWLSWPNTPWLTCVKEDQSEKNIHHSNFYIMPIEATMHTGLTVFKWIIFLISI